jgi:hypothetical protein
MKRQREMTEVRIERQVAKVARLSRELRFELLLLDRYRTGVLITCRGVRDGDRSSERDG